MAHPTHVGAGPGCSAVPRGCASRGPQSFGVAPSPVPRPVEAPRPKAALTGAGFVLLGLVAADVAGGDGPALPYHPGIDLGSIRQRADREDALVAVGTGRLARQFAVPDVGAQARAPPFSRRATTALRGPGRFDPTRARRCLAGECARRKSRWSRRQPPRRCRHAARAMACSSVCRRRPRAGRAGAGVRQRAGWSPRRPSRLLQLRVLPDRIITMCCRFVVPAI